MNISQKDTDAALKVQSKLEKQLKENPRVNGLSVSTLPGKHMQVCIKVIVDDKNITNSSLGINDRYDDIPVIISFEENRPM